MRLHKTTEYAIRILIHVGKHGSKPLSTQRLHEALGIPYKYLGRLMTTLTKNGFLQVQKGKFGGYQLAPNPKDIRMIQVISIFEGHDLFERCLLGMDGCSKQNPCPIHRHWDPIRTTLKMKFNKLSLKDLMNEST